MALELKKYCWKSIGHVPRSKQRQCRHKHKYRGTPINRIYGTQKEKSCHYIPVPSANHLHTAVIFSRVPRTIHVYRTHDREYYEIRSGCLRTLRIIDNRINFSIVIQLIARVVLGTFFTVRLHVMQRTVLLSQFCLSVCPSVRPSDACIVTKLNNALRIF